MARTRLQLQTELLMSSPKYTGVLHCMRTVAKHEGIRGLQKGLVASMSYQLIMNGSRLGLHGPVKDLLGASDPHASLFTLRSMAAGVVTGGIGSLLGSPFQLLKVRMQTKGTALTAVGQQHDVPGVWHGLRQLARGGPKGLVEGAGAGILRVMVGSAVQLGTYDTVKHAITSHFALPPGLMVYIASSAVSGACVAACMAPFDLVSTRIYNAPPGRYSGIADAAAKTVRAEGLRGLYKGAWALYLRLAPHSVITLVTFEFLKGAVHRA
jgi:solute carrier family 25 protein 34/35